MESIQQLLATGDMPVREDGTIDLTELARMSLEDMVNQIMDIQADELVGEGNRRNGYRERRLVTPVGEIVMRVPKLREGTYFPDELIRPYSRVDRAMVAVVREVYVRGLSTRKIEKAAEALEFASLSPSRVSRMTADLDEEVAALGARRFDGMSFPYLWLDATYLSCRDEGHVQSKGLVTAIACGEDGSRQFVGLDAVDTESAASWKAFLLSLRRRGVSGVRCVVSDAHDGLVQAIAEVFQGAAWQRCIVHLERDVAGWFSRKEDRAVAMAAMKAVFAERDPQLVRAAYRVATRRIAEIRGLPRLPLRAPRPPAHQQRPGARQRGDKAQDEGRGRVPLGGVDDAARGLGADRRERGVDGDELHRRVLPEGRPQVGARPRAGARRRGREGEGLRNGRHRGEAWEGRMMLV